MGVKELLKRFDASGGRILYGGLIALMLGMFVWLAGGRVFEALPFLGIGVAYAFAVYRIVSLSVRAYSVMLWTFLLNYYALISIDLGGGLDIPAAGPWFVGFLIGGIAGAHIWSGPGSGAEIPQLRQRRPADDGSFAGGWHLALINAACAVALLGMGAAQLVLISPTLPAVAALAVAALAGWSLFRFPPPLPVRNGLILVIPAVYFVLLLVGGAIGQMAVPHSWAYGALAGILIGGRYWTGSRLGAPRPPYAVRGQGRRRRKRRSRAKQAQAL